MGGNALFEHKKNPGNQVMCIPMKTWYMHNLHNHNCVKFIGFYLAFQKEILFQGTVSCSEKSYSGCK